MRHDSLREGIVTDTQVSDLARPIVAIAKSIADYYSDPAHEKAYQEWFKQKFGKDVPKGE